MSRAARAARPAARAETPAPRSGAWAEIAIVLGIAAGWMAIAAAIAAGYPTIHFDTLRDMAYAQNILRGRVWADPMLAGQTWWYPPGNPLLFAGLSRLTGRSIVDLYPSGIFWLNALNPVMLYLLVRVATRSRTAGVLALPMVGLGSCWWLTHAAAALPGIQGVALNLGGLMLWHRAQRGGWSWLLATGLVIGLAFWHHPLCGAVLTLAIAMHGAICAAWPAAEEAAHRLAVLGRAAVASVIGLALGAPILAHLMTLPRLNPAPFAWFGPELHDPRFALHAHAPLVVPIGLLGAWALWRALPGARWLVAYLLVGLAGETAGYLGHDLRWPVPYTLPHEFQWHEQLALGIAAAFGTVWLARKARGAARWVALAGIALAALGPAVADLRSADFELIHLDARWRSSLQSAAWIRTHLPDDAIIACHPDAAYTMAGLTGRKTVALPEGHMNPAVDAQRRYADLGVMLTTPDPQQFQTVATTYGVTHLMALPQPGLAAAVRQTYARWPILEPLDSGDSTVLVYRVRSGERGR